MNHKILSALVTSVALLATASTSSADGTGLPGDPGRFYDGVLPVNPPTRRGPMPRATVRAPAINLALRAAQAIAEGCNQYPLGVAVVNAAGAPTLIYVPDGSDPSHGYTALRKAYTAVTFKAPTSQLVAKAQQDAAFGAKIKADPNLMAFSGGILLKVGVDIIGAIGVSGAEPGGHDEECGLTGLQQIRSLLK